MKALQTLSNQLPTIPSFGNKSLQKNIEEGNQAIARTEYLEHVWDKSRSQWQMKHLVCNQADGWLRLRQVAAEMSKKRMALSEAQFKYSEHLVKAQIRREKAEKATGLEAQLLNIKADRAEYYASEILVKVEGALKEVQGLAAMHDSLKEQLGEVNEAEFEKAQTKAHIKKAMQLAIRDVRYNNTIGLGAQGYLEDSGVCISHARKAIDEYLAQEQSVSNTSLLYSFLDEYAELVEPAADLQLELLGYDPSTLEHLTYNPQDDNHE
jgi:hypothetical protein